MKFGRDYARRLKRKRASRREIWRLDEVVVTIGGKQHWYHYESNGQLVRHLDDFVAAYNLPEGSKPSTASHTTSSSANDGQSSLNNSASTRSSKCRD